MGQKAHGLGWMGTEGDLQGSCLPNKRQGRRVVVFYLTAMSCIRLSFKLKLLPPNGDVKPTLGLSTHLQSITSLLGKIPLVFL